MCQIQILNFSGHLYLSSVWLGVDVRMDAKKTCVYERLCYMLRTVNHSRLNSRHIWGSLHGRIMALALLTLKEHSCNRGDQKIPCIVAKISYHSWIQEKC